jgi:NAD-dependent dihydropyrimidine dehydrogenase PreA subunit
VNNIAEEYSPEEQVYRDLQQHLDLNPIGFPSSPQKSDIDVLRSFFTPIEAQIATALRLLPSSIKKIQKRLHKKGIKIEKDNLEHRLDEMHQKGIINRINPVRKAYINNQLAVGFFEFSVDKMNADHIKNLHNYMDQAFQAELFATTIPQLRTIPIEAAITPEHQIGTYDDIKTYLKANNVQIVVANCVCKQGEDLIHQPCKKTEKRDLCMILGDFGKVYLERGQGKQITVEEALIEIVENEKIGLVLQPTNQMAPAALCFCCGCCCGILTNLKRLPNPADYSGSNYRASIDTKKCIGCGICAKQRCQIEAIEQINPKSYQINPNRCIGCGLCVPTCPSHAIRFEQKTKLHIPPKNVQMMYLSVLYKKVGLFKTIKWALQQLI